MDATRSTIRLLALSLLVIRSVTAHAEDRHPVYVGTEVCASCHNGPGMGHQTCRWLTSKHASAYASLADPESKAIARLSGIPQEPQEAAVCLGCHATASEAEDWEKDDTFHTEDGVQCEKCHGPGSEYSVSEEVMSEPRLAAAAGLKIPTPEDCLGCHLTKGSHENVLRRPPLDMEEAWQRIAHPSPSAWQFDALPEPPEPSDAASSSAKVTGVMVCAECHQGRDSGFQFSRWRVTPHARAYAVLGSPVAKEIAEQMGVEGDPLRAEACLVCHTTGHHVGVGGTLPSYTILEGVGCEACHAPGSEYRHKDIMQDGQAARRAGLADVAEQTCLACHDSDKAHGRPFDYQAGLATVAHPTQLPPVAEDPLYKTPLRMALTPDGRELFITCEASHTVIVVDTATRRKVAEIVTGHHPTGVALSPDGARAYVSNRLDDTVSVLHTAARKVIATIPVGDEPHGLLTDAQGRYLYVLNTSSNSVSVIDMVTNREVKRLAAGRGPWSLASSPDRSEIYVTNTLSQFVPFRQPSQSEVTVIDTAAAVVTNRIVVPGANLLQGIAWSPSGDFALITLNRTKNLVPMTRLLQGWTITNGLGVIWRDGRVDQVLLDEPNLCFPDPTDVAITPDGRLAVVTSSGSDRLAVVDLAKLTTMLRSATPHERDHVFPNHLGKPTEFVLAHIPVENSPRGVLIAADGRTAFVANALNDSITVVDIGRLEAVGRIDLGGPREITEIRHGERVFHSANVTFHRQFSCHSCHPDGHIDGLTYDIEPDGLGISPVDNRTLRGILDTAPFKWEGTNPSLQRQCGPRLAVFFTRIQPFTPRELDALTNYICTIPRPPNVHRPLGAELTDAQRRGKAMFERTETNDGREIVEDQRCVTCHFPPLYTNRRTADVGTQSEMDRDSEFDIPHLSNIYDSAPYLHDGRSETLEEIWTKYNPYDQHGVTNDMTKDQLNDLIEYLKTL